MKKKCHLPGACLPADCIDGFTCILRGENVDVGFEGRILARKIEEIHTNRGNGIHAERNGRVRPVSYLIISRGGGERENYLRPGIPCQWIVYKGSCWMAPLFDTFT